MRISKTKPGIKNKKRDALLPMRKKVCRFCADKNRVIDYKEVKLLESFIRERGKILPSRVSGNCAKHQRKITEAVKKARFISLLPYVRL
jgi:small subunit ribosomal protein S18